MTWACPLAVTVVAAFCLLPSGCSEIQTPTAYEVLTHPFGAGGPFTRGTSKQEVLDAWGPPKHVVTHGTDELGLPKEEWIYEGWLPSLPIDHEYLARTKHLFFEGNHLVRWKEEVPPGASEAEVQSPPL